MNDVAVLMLVIIAALLILEVLRTISSRMFSAPFNPAQRAFKAYENIREVRRLESDYANSV